MNIIISNSNDRPIYEQICNQIKSAILRGEMCEGEPLPSIRAGGIAIWFARNY